jgi:agmatine deiminase
MNAKYRMPAEFENQEGVWISFPKNRGTFPDEIIEKVEETFVQIIKTISEDEKVFLSMSPFILR